MRTTALPTLSDQTREYWAARQSATTTRRAAALLFWQSLGNVDESGNWNPDAPLLPLRRIACALEPVHVTLSCLSCLYVDAWTGHVTSNVSAADKASMHECEADYWTRVSATESALKDSSREAGRPVVKRAARTAASTPASASAPASTPASAPTDTKAADTKAAAKAAADALLPDKRALAARESLIALITAGHGDEELWEACRRYVARFATVYTKPAAAPAPAAKPAATPARARAPRKAATKASA